MSPTLEVALVTASSAGLGAAVAEALATRSYRVVINYHSRESKALEVREACEAVSPSPSNSKSNYLIVKADATTKTGVQHLVSETVKAFGRLDLVVSNSGYTRFTNFFNFDEGCLEEDWDNCFNANVKTHLWLFQAAKPYLEKLYEESEAKERGAFISIASTAGIKPAGSSLPYAVSKAAQIHLVRCLSVICGPKVRVNTVSPGLMLTEWGLKFPEDKVQAIREKSALKDIATPEDVASMVVHVATNRSLTGQNLVMDAGFTVV